MIVVVFHCRYRYQYQILIPISDSNSRKKHWYQYRYKSWVLLSVLLKSWYWYWHRIILILVLSKLLVWYLSMIYWKSIGMILIRYWIDIGINITSGIGKFCCFQKKYHICTNSIIGWILQASGTGMIFRHSISIWYQNQYLVSGISICMNLCNQYRYRMDLQY